MTGSGKIAALAVLAVALAVLARPAPGWAADPAPHPGIKTMATPYSYKVLVSRLQKAIRDNRMAIVARASATLGAKSLGVTIPGNMVVMVFRPDFAVRMLEASVAAGIEAPLRLYITEGLDGKATLAYPTPSSVFAPYGSAALDEMAAELDIIFARIARDAAGP